MLVENSRKIYSAALGEFEKKYCFKLKKIRKSKQNSINLKSKLSMRAIC